MSHFPFEHTAGTTLNFKVSASGYPSSEGWTLRYYLTPRFSTPTQAQITFDATANDDGTYQLQRSPVQTSTWTAGVYGWHREVISSGGGEKHLLTGSHEQGEVQIKAHPSTLTQGHDSRSHARKVLEAIEAMMESRATQTQRDLVAYTIGNRSQTFDTSDTKEALVTLHSKYKWLVANEDARDKMAAGLPNPRRVGVRFSR